MGHEPTDLNYGFVFAEKYLIYNALFLYLGPLVRYLCTVLRREGGSSTPVADQTVKSEKYQTTAFLFLIYSVGNVFPRGI